MVNLSVIGRMFYGISIAGLGFQTIYDHDFPYMLIPTQHSWIPRLEIVCYIFGAMLVLAGASIVFGKKTRPVAIFLGTVLLLIFCFYFIPYQLMVSPNYMHFGDWENSAKELALSGGTFVITGCFPEKKINLSAKFFKNSAHFGTILYCITIISFGISHFLYGKAVVDYMPSWVPVPLFWAYFVGIPLVGSPVAIILKIKPRLFATLLGSMIFVWVIIVHMPKVIAASSADRGGELTSLFLALAYSGIAFVIAGTIGQFKSK